MQLTEWYMPERSIMPNRPRPRPEPRAFDVFKPGKGQPSPTSRPIIVSHKPYVQDHMVVEQHGVPVANAHPVTIPHHAKQPVLRSLSPRHASAPTSPPHDAAPMSSPTPVEDVPEVSGPKKLSHTGHIIARPSGAVSKHATLLHHK